MNKHKHGWTLVETVISLMILGLLMAIAVPSVQKIRAIAMVAGIITFVLSVMFMPL